MISFNYIKRYNWIDLDTNSFGEFPIVEVQPVPDWHPIKGFIQLTEDKYNKCKEFLAIWKEYLLETDYEFGRWSVHEKYLKFDLTIFESVEKNQIPTMQDWSRDMQQVFTQPQN